MVSVTAIRKKKTTRARKELTCHLKSKETVRNARAMLQMIQMLHDYLIQIACDIHVTKSAAAMNEKIISR